MKDALHVIRVLLGRDYLERQLDTSRSGGCLMLDGQEDEDDVAWRADLLACLGVCTALSSSLASTFLVLR